MNLDSGGGAQGSSSFNIAYNKYLIKHYNYGDTGPFLVLIRSNQLDRNLGNIHPIKIGRELRKANIQGISKITRKGKQILGIEFFSIKSANDFIDSDFPKNNNLETAIPVSLVTCRGVVRGIPVDVTPIEFTENTKSPAKIVSARRISKKSIDQDGNTVYTPTETMIVTFAGQKLPKDIRIEYYHSRVSTYIPPVIQCSNCLRYGHFQTSCRSKQRCANCAEEHETQSCTVDPACVYCGQGHQSTSRTCPEYERQKNIKRKMAFENIPYHEARAQCPKQYECPNNSQNVTKKNKF